MDNTKANYYDARGTTYYNLGKYKEAAEDYTRAISIKPAKSYYANRADVYDMTGEL